MLSPMKLTETPAVGRDSDKFMLRLPDGMRERIATAAKESGRSMNAEIVGRLQASFDENQRFVDVANLLQRSFVKTDLDLHKAKAEISNLMRMLQIAAEYLSMTSLAEDQKVKSLIEEWSSLAPPVESMEKWQKQAIEKSRELGELNAKVHAQIARNANEMQAEIPGKRRKK